VWMLGRILPMPVASTLWGLLALSLAVYLLASLRGRYWRYVLAAAAVGYGAALLLGAVRGGVDPLQPWQAFRPSPGRPAERAAFLPVKSVADLELMLAEAQRQQRPVLLDFYADWCVACLKMEHEVFGDPAVRAALGNILLLRADVTANDAQDRALLRALGVYGPPTLLFFAADGSERKDLRLVGETDSAGLLARLHRLDGR
jgi:thioredoxin:protein disulfide reductase